jgi:hypothetical protein
MQKMFVYPEVIQSAIVDGLTVNEAERARSKAGIVSYRCKVYRARLGQGTESGRGDFVGMRFSIQKDSMASHNGAHR